VRLSVCLLALAAVMAAVFALPRDADAHSAEKTLKAIEAHRSATWRWQRLMGVRQTRITPSERRPTGIRYLDRLEELWARRARAARRRAARPPHASAWRCIKRHESDPRMGWRTHTGNGYYGGLQLDLAFQRTHGSDLLRRKGTADRWTPLEQMWVAERALRSGEGFYHWPNTARTCGLL
jgi:Transglycosylase-like domain